MAEVRGNLHLGKSGLHQGTVPGNARAEQSDGQRHREQTASYVEPEVRLRHNEVRVKRWSKSPPRRWQHRWHGKPYREQCQIGAARARVTSNRIVLIRAGPGWQLEGVW